MAVPPATALLIDAMGTLVRLEPPAPILRAELQRRFGLRLSGRQAQLAITAEIRHYRAHMSSGRDAASVQSLRVDCAEAMRAALAPDLRLPGVTGVELAAALVASLRFRAFADAGPALAAVRERGLAVVVVSNWDAGLTGVLTEVGLTGSVDAVVTSAQVGAAKPAPAMFAAGLDAAGAGARQALHVGDSLVQDVAGARASGLRALWCNRDRAPVPDGVQAIAGLDELDARIAQA